MLTSIGVWTLLFGALLSVEKFTIKKLVGVLASLGGIVLISSIDVSSNPDKNRGSFPHKSHKEIAIGDILAFTSAIMYGIYTTLMKKRIGDESRVDMILFFGFVGLFNFITLLPGFFILHFTRIETFELPPTRRILAIVLASSGHISRSCLADSSLDQFSYLVGRRSLLGLLHATYVAFGHHSRIESDHSAFSHWPND